MIFAMFAQSVLEYAAISGLLAKGKEVMDSALAWVAELSPETWMAAGGVLVLLLIVWGRWRSRA